MTKLLYRGQNYIKYKAVETERKVKLTYQQNKYQLRREANASGLLSLSYRGVKYHQNRTKLNSSKLKDNVSQQIIFLLARNLSHSQFELADKDLTNRLWQEVADLGIDPERIINLMYRANSYQDDDMYEADLLYYNPK